MIGIFDSGIGGLTVARAVMDQLPDYDIIYFGDTARTPYGSKSPDTVVKYSIENTEFLLSKGAKIIIMACNTASSVAFETVAEKFNYPLFEVITPAAKLAVKKSRTNRIGVIGTRATVNSRAYENKIKRILPEAKVHSNPCPLLVPIVEEGWLKRPETRMIIKKYLYPLKIRQIDTLILGCTHYPLLSNIIQKKIGQKVTIIDSSFSTAENVKEFLQNNSETDSHMSKKGKANFFVSDLTVQFEKIARVILRKKICLELVKI